MSKKAKKNRTLFASGGEIHEYPGDCLGLNIQCSADEWSQIVLDTLRFKLYLQALKDVGCPATGEPWDRKDEFFLRALTRTVARMRNIDALLLLKVDEDAELKAYKEKMVASAIEIRRAVDIISNEMVDAANVKEVSDL